MRTITYIASTLTRTRSVCSVSDQSVNPVDPVAEVGETPFGGVD